MTALAVFILMLAAATAVALARVRDLFAVVILLAALSGEVVVALSLLGAVDVAFTEAVVGTGASTVYFMALLRRVEPGAVARRRGAAGLGALAAALAVGIGLGWAMLSLPPFGDPASPAALHVSPEYAARSLADTATPNVVTAILADYRGLDTLIETTVVLTAAVACALVLRRKP